MIYKSRQVNLDPEPWVHYAYDGFSHERRASPEPLGEIEGGVADLKPRPEFEPTRDPEPWLEASSGKWRHQHFLGPLTDGKPFVQWAPRREQFDTPVNRVLARFRHASEYEFILANLDAYLIGVQGWATSDEIDHARKVLTRLAGWSA